MLTSLAFIFLAGLAMAAVCERIGLPRIIGMLFTGIVLGPYVLNLLDPSILGISSELRQMALIIILLKAGLSLNLADLKKVGRPAMMMAFVPASFEIFAFFLFAPYVLGITRVEAAVMGAVLGAVPGSRDSADGAADGKQLWDAKEHPSDDYGGCILRRYFRHRSVYDICPHGAGRKRKGVGLCADSDFDRVRRCAGSRCRLCAGEGF